MTIVRIQGNNEKRIGVYYEYDIDAAPLGEGGMGRVFKGFRVIERTGERTPVAIKAIYENIPERVVERARREAEVQLDHENLIRMYGFVETETLCDNAVRGKKHYHVIMELLVGVTLEDMINGITTDHNGLQIPYAAELYAQYSNNRSAAVVRVMKPVLAGLMTLHDKGYIHRDIDPSNIMITIDRKIKLIDFGICKQIISLESKDKALTSAGVFMGKVNYAAPELVLGDVKSQNYTTDIYAMGILLYQLCAGHLPFSGTDQDVMAANLRSKLPMKDVRGKDFKRIILKATDKIQTRRYSSAAEFRVDLEKLDNTVSVNRRPKNGKIGWRILGGVLTALVLSTLFIKVMRKPEKTETTTAEDIYFEAKQLQKSDTTEIRNQGNALIAVLANDSLYIPAIVDYNIQLLNSPLPEKTKEGYSNLLQLAEGGEHRAMFECGLTLSESNKKFRVSKERQVRLGIRADVKVANMWLYQAMQADSTDYKSVYWALNNLIYKMNRGEIYTKDMVEAKKLYAEFIARVELVDDDPTLMLYLEAMDRIRETLYAWGVLK